MKVPRATLLIEPARHGVFSRVVKLEMFIVVGVVNVVITNVHCSYCMAVNLRRLAKPRKAWVISIRAYSVKSSQKLYKIIEDLGLYPAQSRCCAKTSYWRYLSSSLQYGITPISKYFETKVPDGNSESFVAGDLRVRRRLLWPESVCRLIAIIVISLTKHDCGWGLCIRESQVSVKRPTSCR